MNFAKTLAATLLAAFAVGASAASVTNTITKNVGTVSTINGALNYQSDYLPGVDGTVSWTVPATTTKTSGGNTVTTKYVDVFTDVYKFTLDEGQIVTADVQSSSLSAWSLKGSTTTLSLYEGTYTAGTSLTGYTLLDTVAYTTSGTELVSTLAAGDYFYVIKGTTSGKNGGQYTFEVTAVPEPANAALLLAGLGLFGVVAKRRKLG